MFVGNLQARTVRRPSIQASSSDFYDVVSLASIVASKETNPASSTSRVTSRITNPNVEHFSLWKYLVLRFIAQEALHYEILDFEPERLIIDLSVFRRQVHLVVV